MMAPQIRRTVSPVASGLVAMLGALGAAGQDAVLQLAVVGPVAGGVESSEPSISCSNACSAVATIGSMVTLTAVPTPGNTFESWSGDCSGLQPTCTLTMDGIKLAIASFKRPGDLFTVIHRFLPGGNGLSPSAGLLEDDGYLYAMTASGGRAGVGTIYRERRDGGEHTILHDFLGFPTDGEQPYGALIAVGGALYGTTAFGGAGGVGTIFKIGAGGSGYAVLHSFARDQHDGGLAEGSLVELDGVLYGTTYSGGAFGTGTVFRINPDGHGFSLLHSFDVSDGHGPGFSLLPLDGALYGVTSVGGLGGGVIFRINPDGSGFALLHVFYSDDPMDRGYPTGPLAVVDGALYGVTLEGGLYKIDPDGGGYTILHSFAGYPTDGATPQGPLVFADGGLYGATSSGGAGDCTDGGSITYGCGTIFKINPDGSGYGIVRSFEGNGLDWPDPVVLLASEGTLLGTAKFVGDGPAASIFQMHPDGSDFAVVHAFTRGGVTEGNAPYGSVVESGGALYGMTSQGGPGSCQDRSGKVIGCGTIFKINPDGTGYTLEHAFAGGASDGSMPYGSLTASGEVLFGMTSQGGAGDLGTIFGMKADDSYRLLYSFAGGAADGDTPLGSLLESGGTLYGMTSRGGTGYCPGPVGNSVGCGTIFSFDTNGSAFTLLHSFDTTSDAGRAFGSLIAAGGALYGVASNGFSHAGALFGIGSDGSDFSVLHSFLGGPEGQGPVGSPLVLNGALFGMTSADDVARPGGAIFRINEDGSGLTVLHTCVNEPNSTGSAPAGSLIAQDGVLYGMTTYGGDETCRSDASDIHGCGTVFSIAPDGRGYTVLHAFGGADGSTPQHAALTPFDGRVYGLTAHGGIGGNGVLFRLDLPKPRARRYLSWK